MTTLPIGGRAVLQNIAMGRSAWHGWDAGHPATTPEGIDAFKARKVAIESCRERGLITDENLFTEAGKAAVKAMEALLG